MHKVVRKPEFTAPVTVYEPADGGQREGRFKARFRALPRSEIAAYDLRTYEGTVQFLTDVVIGWEGLVEDDKTPFEFSPGNLSDLLDMDHYRMAFSNAYFDSTSGIKAARRGN